MQSKDAEHISALATILKIPEDILTSALRGLNLKLTRDIVVEDRRKR
jgi:hypothetical protein